MISIVVPKVNKRVETRIATWLKQYIEEVDRKFIGVDIHIGRINLSLCYARIVIHNLKIDNPEGYKSEHMMTVKQLTLDLDLLELLRTRGKHVVVEEFKLQQVEAIVEFKNIVWGIGESNLHEVQDFASGKKPEKDNGSSSVSKSGDMPATSDNSTQEKDAPDPVQGKEEEAPKKKGPPGVHVDEGGVRRHCCSACCEAWCSCCYSLRRHAFQMFFGRVQHLWRCRPDSMFGENADKVHAIEHRQEETVIG